MTEFPDALSLEQFRRDADTIPDTAVRIASIPDLLVRLLHRPPGSGYETKKARLFRPEDFNVSFLGRDELNRLNGFKVLKKQVEWSCGRFMVKSLVRDVLALERGLQDINILYRPQGAPYIEGFEDYSLTLSHSNSLTAAALATAPGLALGIDIEAIGPMPDAAFMKIAFTQREIRAMVPRPEDVFRCWTLKEAYLKFIGKGFNESLLQVEILGRNIRHNGEEQLLHTRSWQLKPGYALSLVAGRAR